MVFYIHYKTRQTINDTALQEMIISFWMAGYLAHVQLIVGTTTSGKRELQS